MIVYLIKRTFRIRNTDIDKLAHLQKKTGKHRSEILRRSIVHYFNFIESGAIQKDEKGHLEN